MTVAFSALRSLYSSLTEPTVTSGSDSAPQGSMDERGVISGSSVPMQVGYNGQPQVNIPAYTQSWSGLDPNVQNRPSLIPVHYYGSQPGDWTAPEWLKGAADAVSSLYLGSKGYPIGESDAMALAGNFTGGGFLGGQVLGPAAEAGSTVLSMNGAGGRSAEAMAELVRRGKYRDISGGIPVVDRNTGFLHRVGDVNAVNDMNVTMTDPKLRYVPVARAEDLIDRAGITGITDTSRADLSTVTSVNGVPVESLQRGGAYYGMQPENIERGDAFASADSAVTGQYNRARFAQKKSDRPGVVFAPHGMVGSSPDFATMPAEIAVQYAQQQMDNNTKALLDKRIREGKPGKGKSKGFTPVESWPGIDNVTPEYMSSIGGDRKQVLYAMEQFKQDGALGLSQLRAIVTDPNQINRPWGDVNAMYLLNPDNYAKGNIITSSTHPSYGAALRGTPLGATREGVSILDFNPSMGNTAKTERNFAGEMQARTQSALRNLKAAETSGDINNAKKYANALAGLNMNPGSTGSSVQGALKAGGQFKFTQPIVDDLIKRGIILP